MQASLVPVNITYYMIYENEQHSNNTPCSLEQKSTAHAHKYTHTHTPAHVRNPHQHRVFELLTATKNTQTHQKVRQKE